jgi:hypothetical protein
MPRRPVLAILATLGRIPAPQGPLLRQLREMQERRLPSAAGLAAPGLSP